VSVVPEIRELFAQRAGEEMALKRSLRPRSRRSA
jgi:hypothetical protein